MLFIICTVLLLITFAILAVSMSYLSSPKTGIASVNNDTILTFYFIMLFQSGVFAVVLVPVILVWLISLLLILFQLSSNKMREYSLRVTKNEKDDVIPYKYD